VAVPEGVLDNDANLVIVDDRSLFVLAINQKVLLKNFIPESVIAAKRMMMRSRMCIVIGWWSGS
jgi:hypothetical protein